MKNPHFVNIEPGQSGSDSEDRIQTEPFDKKTQAKAKQAAVLLPDISLAIAKVCEEPFIQTGQHSDIGTHRKQNEDTAMSIVSLCGGETPLVPLAISLVADGMGGHADGANASRSVSNYVCQNLLSRILIPLMSNTTVTEPVQSIMKRAVQDASRVIHTDDSEQIGGTTLTCGVIIKSRLFLAHVGDSRAYLFDESSGALKQITHDHSYVQQLIDSGEITPEEAAVHPRRNLLYRAITGAEVEIDMFTCALPKTGTLMICSDGLWGSAPDAMMQQVIANNKISLQDRCEQLVALAIEGGTTDNISVVLTSFRL
ncbi:MAG: PP2C family serine/threonine-protein phosphatase [Anaerolineae bacterium]